MKNLRLKCLAIIVMALSVAAQAQVPDVRLTRVTNPARSIGIEVGDLLERRLEIEVAPPYQLSRTALPPKGVNRGGIELADIRIESAQVAGRTRYAIDLRYQVFARAGTPGMMHTPVEEFALTGGPKALSIRLPEWRFWFSPLAAANIKTARESLQPQYKPELPGLDEHRLHLLAFLGLLLGGLAGLVYYNLDSRWLPFMNGPFARAHRTLGRLRQGQERHALLCLHQAFNQVHGATMFAADIAGFCLAHPSFSGMKQDIESFFGRSNLALFGGQSHEGEQFIKDLRVLGRALRDCERGAS